MLSLVMFISLLRNATQGLDEELALSGLFLEFSIEMYILLLVLLGANYSTKMI